MIRRFTDSRRGLSFALSLSFALALPAAVGCKSKPKPEEKPTVREVKPPETKYGLTPEQEKQTLVKVGEETITLGEFAERLGGQSPYLRARYNSPERRREFLDNLVRFELLSLEASKRGFDKTEDVARTRKQMMVQQMMQELFDKQGVKLSDITDAEIKTFYDANKGEFEKPAQVRASHIQFKDKASAEKVLKELKAKPADMELFRKLAQQYNQDPATKSSYGDLHFFSATKDDAEGDEAPRPDAVRKAAFSLEKVGDLSPEVVSSEAGFHIVKLTGKRDAMKRSLDDARRLIQNRLWRQKREEAIEKFVADLRAKANVKENLDLLAQVKVQPSAKSGAGDDEAPPTDAKSKKPDAHAPHAH
jgi:peptidyl-prolyl cis-trans isomerase C